MTYEEATRNRYIPLGEFIDALYWDPYNEKWEMSDEKMEELMRNAVEIVDALEKQIPKKPIVDEWERVKCANGHNIPVLSRNQNMPYCPFCGQHIDWS